ncbi:hypothetical protein QFC19_001536 [Naganishia cerealis]|uniref:Uncharacterized protein n=1 Tax=Naganishia cerealis TaxID=610337 RepID=A0ACC2WGC8_9TREE|nr:hypothetical protein QFC19_001536 [Naganishia cerealis]
MEDPSITVSAFLAYAQAALQEDGNRTQEIHSMKDALSSHVLIPLVGTRQAVWNDANERYVRMIQGLEQKYQERLKEVIENALTNLSKEQGEEYPEEERDAILQEAELCYRMARRASNNLARHIQTGQETKGTERASVPIEQLEMHGRTYRKASAGTHQSSEAADHSNFTIGESDSDAESSDLETRRAYATGDSAMPPRAQVSDRLKELEIERLSNDLDEKVDELKNLEIQLEESRQHVDAYLRTAKKLRKSENVVEKLKKKLDSVANARSEIQQQVKMLSDENADWESKYTELIRSRKPPKSTSPSAGLSSESQLSEISMRLQQLELALQTKQAEVAQLKEIAIRRHEKSVDEYPSYVSSDDEQASPQNSKVKVRPLASSLQLPAYPDENLNGFGENVRNNQQPENQSAQSDSTPGRQGKRPGGRSGVDNATCEDVARLESEVARLQQSLVETEQRYRAEKLLMLKAWTDLGQRTMRMGVPDDGDGVSGGNNSEARGMGRLFGLSWASRVRQRMPPAPDSRA